MVERKQNSAAGGVRKTMQVVAVNHNTQTKFKELGNDGQIDGVVLNDTERKYLLPHFLLLIIGKPGSGKTFLIQQFLRNENFYKGKFQKTFAVSPSVVKLDLPVSKENTHTQFDIGWIFDKIDAVNDEQLTKLNAVFGKTYNKRLAEEYGVNQSANATHVAGSARKSYQERGKGKLEQSCGAGIKGKARGKQPQQQQQHTVMVDQGLGASLYRRVDFKKQQQIPGKSDHELWGSGGGGMCTQKDASRLTFITKDTYIDYLKLLTMEERRQLHCNVLFVFDDVVADIKAEEYTHELAKLIMNRRHLLVNGTVSVMIVSQKYSLIPSRVRSNANWMILFKLNPADEDFVYGDAVTFSHKTWLNVLTHVFGDGSGQAETDQKAEQIQNETTPSKPQAQIDRIMATKNFNNLGIWVEQNLYFMNFEQLIIK